MINLTHKIEAPSLTMEKKKKSKDKPKKITYKHKHANKSIDYRRKN